MKWKKSQFKTLDLDSIQQLNYPPDHPLTLAMQFANLVDSRSQAVGVYSGIISGWVKNLHPELAIKTLLKSNERDRSYNLNRFALACSNYLNEPEPYLHLALSLVKKPSKYLIFGDDSDTNNYELCSFRNNVCIGYAESLRLNRIALWLSKIGLENHHDATVRQITEILLKRGQLDELQQWAAALSNKTATILIWCELALFWVRRNKLETALEIVERKLGGPMVAPIEVNFGIIAALRKSNRKSELKNWLQTTLYRIETKPKQKDGSFHVPFEIICSCEWLGEHEQAERLWPTYKRNTLEYSKFLVAKGCAGSTEFACVAREAHVAGLAELTNKIAGLYLEFMQESKSAPKSVAAAKEQLLSELDAPVPSKNEMLMTPEKIASDFRQIETLPETARESAWCGLVYRCANQGDWDSAITALVKTSELSNPRNGWEYVRSWAQRICESIGKPGCLSEAGQVNLRQLFLKLNANQSVK